MALKNTTSGPHTSHTKHCNIYFTQGLFPQVWPFYQKFKLNIGGLLNNVKSSNFRIRWMCCAGIACSMYLRPRHNAFCLQSVAQSLCGIHVSVLNNVSDNVAKDNETNDQWLTKFCQPYEIKRHYRQLNAGENLWPLPPTGRWFNKKPGNYDHPRCLWQHEE